MSTTQSVQLPQFNEADGYVDGRHGDGDSRRGCRGECHQPDPGGGAKTTTSECSTPRRRRLVRGSEGWERRPATGWTSDLSAANAGSDFCASPRRLRQRATSGSTDPAVLAQSSSAPEPSRSRRTGAFGIDIQGPAPWRCRRAPSTPRATVTIEYGFTTDETTTTTTPTTTTTTTTEPPTTTTTTRCRPRRRPRRRRPPWQDDFPNGRHCPPGPESWIAWISICSARAGEPVVKRSMTSLCLLAIGVVPIERSRDGMKNGRGASAD